jgi:hypothetical protein
MRKKKGGILGEQIKMDWDLLHFNFWTLSWLPRVEGPRRQSAEQQTACKGYWEFCGHLHFEDADIYMGVLKFWESSKKKVKKVGENDVIEISIRALAPFCGLAANGVNDKRIVGALKRLSEFTARRYAETPDGKVNIIRSFQLLNFPLSIRKKGRGAKITLEMSSELRKGIAKRSLHVNYKIIQEIKGEVEKALLMYIEGNDMQEWVTKERLYRYFGLVRPKTPPEGAAKSLLKVYDAQMAQYQEHTYRLNKTVKTALGALVTKGWIKSFAIRKEYGTILYDIKKKGKDEMAEAIKKHRADVKKQVAAKRTDEPIRELKRTIKKFENDIPVLGCVPIDCVAFAPGEVPY